MGKNLSKHPSTATPFATPRLSSGLPSTQAISSRFVTTRSPPSDLWLTVKLVGRCGRPDVPTPYFPSRGPAGLNLAACVPLRSHHRGTLWGAHRTQHARLALPRHVHSDALHNVGCTLRMEERPTCAGVQKRSYLDERVVVRLYRFYECNTWGAGRHEYAAEKSIWLDKYVLASCQEYLPRLKAFGPSCSSNDGVLV